VRSQEGGFLHPALHLREAVQLLGIVSRRTPGTTPKWVERWIKSCTGVRIAEFSAVSRLPHMCRSFPY
jgi:hypothetical protein